MHFHVNASLSPNYRVITTRNAANNNIIHPIPPGFRWWLNARICIELRDAVEALLSLPTDLRHAFFVIIIFLVTARDSQAFPLHWKAIRLRVFPYNYIWWPLFKWYYMQFTVGDIALLRHPKDFSQMAVSSVDNVRSQIVCLAGVMIGMKTNRPQPASHRSAFWYKLAIIGAGCKKKTGSLRVHPSQTRRDEEDVYGLHRPSGGGPFSPTFFLTDMYIDQIRRRRHTYPLWVDVVVLVEASCGLWNGPDALTLTDEVNRTTGRGLGTNHRHINTCSPHPLPRHHNADHPSPSWSPLPTSTTTVISNIDIHCRTSNQMLLTHCQAAAVFTHFPSFSFPSFLLSLSPLNVFPSLLRHSPLSYLTSAYPSDTLPYALNVIESDSHN